MSRRIVGAERRVSVRSLDRIDRSILRRLQSNGRQPVSELAREVHLTRSPCLDRMRRLEQEGFIQGYAALLNPVYLGARLLAFVAVRVDRTTPEILQKFRIAVEALDEVMECHTLAGGLDFLLKVRVADMEAYQRFLSEGLCNLPGIVQTHTYFVIDEVKSTLGFKF